MTQQIRPNQTTYGLLDSFGETRGYPLQESEGTPFAEVMYHINADSPIPADLARRALLSVLNDVSPARDTKLGSLLMGSLKTATPQTVKGFIDAIGTYESINLCSPKEHVLDNASTVIGCAGSGKKGRKTINITTPAMIIAAATGANVLKTGSHSTSSVTGSSDILSAQGFVVPDNEEKSTRLLRETGFGFYAIENLVPEFDDIYGGKFFAPHALSYALPAALIPVGVDSVLYGYSGQKVLTSAMALAEIGYSSVLVCSNSKDNLHYIDEISTEGTTYLAGVQDGKPGHTISFSAKDHFGIQQQKMPNIESAKDVAGQSALFRGILNGAFKDSVAENTICANTATILYLARLCMSPPEGYRLAKDTLREGKAAAKLQDIITASRDIA